MWFKWEIYEKFFFHFGGVALKKGEKSYCNRKLNRQNLWASRDIWSIMFDKLHKYGDLWKPSPLIGKVYGFFWSFPENFRFVLSEFMWHSKKGKSRWCYEKSITCCHILSNELANSREQLFTTFCKLFNFSDSLSSFAINLITFFWLYCDRLFNSLFQLLRLFWIQSKKSLSCNFQTLLTSVKIFHKFFLCLFCRP